MQYWVSRDSTKPYSIFLHPLCRGLAGELDPKALSVWFSTLVNMRSEIASWTARASKHAGVGYPLVTVLLCLEDAPSFGQFVDTLVDNLHRQLKVCASCKLHKDRQNKKSL